MGEREERPPERPIRHFTVEPGTLELTAGAAGTTARSLAGEVNAHFAGCTSAADSHPGWQSAAALQECAQAWVSHLHGHVAALHVVGQKLTSTHQNYHSANHAATEHAKRVAADLPPVQEV